MPSETPRKTNSLELKRLLRRIKMSSEAPRKMNSPALNRLLMHIEHPHPTTTLGINTYINAENELSYSACYDLRWRYVKGYGFSVLTSETREALVKLLAGKKVLESCAGSGYFVSVLRHSGIDIHGIDNQESTYPFGDDESFHWRNPEIRKVSVQDYPVENYDAVILSWPHDGMETLNKMVSGQLFIYQGEGQEGCTGSSEFHESINDEALFEKLDSSDLNTHHYRWDGIHDYWQVYRKL